VRSVANNPATARASGGTNSIDQEDLPALYQSADRESVQYQRMFKRWSQAELLLAVSGAVLGVILTVVRHELVALSTAVVFGAALALRFVIQSRGDDDSWFDGRAVAESVKTDSWRYMMRVPPFQDDATADRVFLRQVNGIIRTVPKIGDFRLPSDGASQITARMRTVRGTALNERASLYRNARLHDQVEWYRLSNERHTEASKRLSRLTMAAQATALVIAVIAFFVPPVGALGLFGAIAAVGVSFGAWNQLNRNAEVARSYRLANQELGTILELAASIGSEDDLAQIVQEGEEAISREHTMWVAKRREVLPPHLAE
jgi:hypothetical protein